MTIVRPDPEVKPLSSKELAQDAVAGGAEPDQDVLHSDDEPGGDTHLPASESDALSEEERKKADPERDVTLLPPD